MLQGSWKISELHTISVRCSTQQHPSHTTGIMVHSPGGDLVALWSRSYSNISGPDSWSEPGCCSAPVKYSAWSARLRWGTGKCQVQLLQEIVSLVTIIIQLLLLHYWNIRFEAERFTYCSTLIFKEDLSFHPSHQSLERLYLLQLLCRGRRWPGRGVSPSQKVVTLLSFFPSFDAHLLRTEIGLWHNDQSNSSLYEALLTISQYCPNCRSPTSPICWW